MDGHECQGFSFYSNFDSANLHRVEFVPKNNENDTPHTTTITGKTDIVDYEFNLWTKPDCAGTEFENGNRTWFYFALKTPLPLANVKFNIIDMNKQAKLYGQGMVPVYRVIPGRSNWERVIDKPTYSTEDVFTLTFKFRMPENINSIIYFAFTYPYSFHDLQNKLDAVDRKLKKPDVIESLDEIYYVRENAIRTVQGRRLDLLTITSYYGITDQRETRLRNLFPDKLVPRPYKFIDKKVIYLSARVHPGETPSSFVLNGFINLILSRDDHIAQMLRRMYVFKIIPCLNPDGVVNGHYRTDTRGVNLNRVYLTPSITEHPTIYAARSLIRYYHYGYERETDELDVVLPAATVAPDDNILTEVGAITLDEKNKKNKVWCNKCRGINAAADTPRPENTSPIYCVNCGDCVQPGESGLFLFLDMHGHASKKGIFMYGNHFDDLESNVRCMVLPKLMSLNNHNFHFTACNFTEKNMYLKDKRDGMSREGSGRVAIYKLTGLIQSYTLECNYNTGRLVNVLPACIKEGSKTLANVVVPPKYTPIVFEEVGRALGASILDLTNSNPYTRISHSEYHSLNGLREWLRIHCTYHLGETRKSPKKAKLRQAASLHAQGKTVRPVLKTRSFPTKYHPKKTNLKQRQLKAAKREKEVVSPQPSCSYNYNNQASSSSSSGGGGTHLHNSRRKPTTTTVLMNQKHSAMVTAGEKRNTTGINYIAKNIRNTSPITQKMKSETRPSSERKADDVKVKEICYVKGVNGKRVIATYERNNREEAENLIVAWDATNSHPQVFTHKSRVPAFINRRNGDGEPRQRPYRVHNFQKSAALQATFSKVKLTKRVFRSTHATTDAAAGKASKSKTKGKKKKTRSKDLA